MAFSAAVAISDGAVFLHALIRNYIPYFLKNYPGKTRRLKPDLLNKK